MNSVCIYDAGGSLLTTVTSCFKCLKKGITCSPMSRREDGERGELGTGAENPETKSCIVL